MSDFVKNNKGIIIFLSALAVFVLVVYLFTRNDNSVTSKLEDNSMINTEINQLVRINVSEEEIARKYLSSFVNLVVYHPENAFELIDAETLSARFPDYNSFLKYRESLINDSFVRSAVRKYAYTYQGNKKTMIVIDDDNNQFAFRENGIMDYTVVIMDYSGGE